MNVLVASVLVPGERTPVWYALQRMFLRRTTEVPFTHAVYLNGADPVRADGTVVIGQSRTNDGRDIAAARVAAFFRANLDRYTHLLVLDPDAWPVCPAWHTVLAGLLDLHGKRVAAPVRHENLEPFPHPCAVFCPAAAADDLAFGTVAYTDAYGRGGKAFQLTGPAPAAVLPLVRSNRVSPHPLFGAVYDNLFYHHGDEGRGRMAHVSVAPRAMAHYLPAGRHAQIESRLYQELLRDPLRLMSRLTGATEAAKC